MKNTSKSLVEQEKAVARHFDSYTKLKKIPYKDCLDDFIIKMKESDTGYLFSINADTCHYKQIIFRALRAAYYSIFVLDISIESKKLAFLQSAPEFWTFVKKHPRFTVVNRSKIIKEFEAYRVEAYNIAPVSSGLLEIRSFMVIALRLTEFNQNLTSIERDFVYTIKEVRPAASYDKKPINLNHWFSQHTWLRRDDLGIGHNKYVKLGSPRALMTSFIITAQSALSIIQASKDALVTFFRDTSISSEDLIKIKPVSDFNHRQQINSHRKLVTKNMCTLIQNKKHIGKDIPNFDFAIRLLYLSNVSLKFRNENMEINFLAANKIDFITSHPIFDFDFISQLMDYASLKKSPNKKMPSCRAEEIFFSWLMASMTVQASNISGWDGLKLSDFIFTRLTSGRVKYLKCSYFKTRANAVHDTITLSTSDDLGKVVLRYIEDVTGLQDRDIPLVSRKFGNPTLSKNGETGRAIGIFTDSLCHDSLLANVKKMHSTDVFYDALKTILSTGVRKLDIGRQSLEISDRITSSQFFGLSMIKTSAVYARTVNYNPSSLINFNSHSNATERDNYLTNNNKEWINNCGRVTRAVIKDLLVNVFSPSQKNVRGFNTEFTQALDYISNKTKETLASQIFVEQSNQSRANDLGIFENKHFSSDVLPDTIYVEDSKWTVMKMEHYIAEVQRKHKLLWQQAPIFLFSTVLPTVEWIEELLDGEYFSENNIKEGRRLLATYCKDLPPFFSSQLR